LSTIYSVLADTQTRGNMGDESPKWAANKKLILDLMNDEKYRLTLAFYPDKRGGDYGYKELNLLPQLDWKIKTLLIHPGGELQTSHWRLSLITKDNKRTFFNNNVEYLLYGYGQMRVGPGDDQRVDIAFDLELTSDQYTLGDFLEALLHPAADEDDAVYQDQPFCWYLYTGYPETKKNLECRHWVQAAARAFYHKGLISTDPTELFNQKNKSLGYPNGQIPKGTFFQEKPELRATLKGTEEQDALKEGFPGWK
jgi:hypothetical protein